MARVSPYVTVTLSAILVGLLASTCSAQVSAHACLTDETTPLALADPNVPDVYRDIMVGTRLTILITSGIESSWSGALWLSRPNLDSAVVSARGYNPASRSGNYEGSCLPAAGMDALVTDYMDTAGLSFDLLSSRDATAGPWFVLDYHALSVGTCSIGLYDYAPSGDVGPDPNPYDPGDPPPFQANLLQVLSFHHVTSRDYNDDALVNFADFAILAQHWRQTLVSGPNETRALDLNADERIDVFDLALFSQYWLERTAAVSPEPDPGDPDAVP
jgi:hypothetical protein